MDNDAWTRWVMQSARTWDDLSFLVRRTGVGAVDADHRRLTEFGLQINRFVDTAEKAAVDLDAIAQQGQLLQDLYDYARDHFTREEALIRRYDLGMMDVQREQHQRILALLQGTLEDYRSGRLMINASLKMAILEWVVVHINHVDYECFTLDKWREALRRAQSWSDVATIVQRTQVAQIDVEHERLTEVFLKLGQALRQAAGPEATAVIAGLFDQMASGAAAHFAHEEDFQQRFQLPGLATQQEQHRQFLALVARYRQRHEREGAAVRDELELALLEWWINHINETDYSMLSMERWGAKVMERATSWDEVAWAIHTTGNPVVDHDHQHLVELALELNKVLAAAERDRARSTQDALELFDRLHALAAAHFQREEAIMRPWADAGLAEHHEEHERLLGILLTYRDHLAANRLSLTGALKVRMMEWWVNHTNAVDAVTFARHRDAAADVMLDDGEIEAQP